MRLSTITKRKWQKGEEWFEKWYNTELEFSVFSKKGNPLARIFTNNGFNVIALNTQWYYDATAYRWDEDKVRAVKKGAPLWKKLVERTEIYRQEIEKILSDLESENVLNKKTLSQFKKGFLLLWRIFLCDLGTPLAPYLEKFLQQKGLTPKERDILIDYCFNFKHPLGYQKEEAELKKLGKKIPQAVLTFSRSYQTLPQKYKLLFEKHTQKYSYLTGLLLNEKPFSEQEFFEKLKTLSVKAIKKPPRRMTQNIQKKLTKEDNAYLYLVHRHVYYDNYAADLNAKLDYLLNQLIHKHYNIDPKTLSWYSFGEIERLVKTGKKLSEKDLRFRKRYRIMIEIDGSISTQYGKKNFQTMQKAIKSLFSAKNLHTLTGFVASRGLIKSTVKIVRSVSDMKKVNKGDILVAPMTHPDLIVAIRKCSGIITDTGGITSHAAIISREFGIPCIVGTLYATQILKDGDIVELDANTGSIHIIKNTT